MFILKNGLGLMAPEGEASGGAGVDEFDITGAMADISTSLGFEEVENGGDDELGGDPGAGDDLDSGGDDTVLEGKKGEQEGKATTPAGDSEDEKASGSKAPITTAESPPRQWRAEAAKEWAKLPLSVREEVAKREEDMFRGIEQYRNDANFAKTVQQVINPYVDTLQQFNLNPLQVMGDLFNAHKTLALGSEELKIGMFRQLARDYHIDTAKAFGVGAAVGAPASEPAYVDPAVQNLQQELKGVQSKLQQTEEAQQAAAREKATVELNAFRADPKNAHFDDVAGDILGLMKSGVCKTLQEAYEHAVWANPVTRSKEIERQSAERSEKEAKEKSEKARKAREAAGANLRTSAKRGSAAAPGGTIDDTLNATYDEIMAKSQ